MEAQLPQRTIVRLQAERLSRGRWGRAFKRLLEVKGIERGETGPKAVGSISETISGIARTVGVDDRTARNRPRQADQFKGLSGLDQASVRNGEKTIGKVETENQGACRTP